MTKKSSPMSLTGVFLPFYSCGFWQGILIIFDYLVLWFAGHSMSLPGRMDDQLFR
jgi:hypothetical protein